MVRSSLSDWDASVATTIYEMGRFICIFSFGPPGRGDFMEIHHVMEFACDKFYKIW